MRDDITELGRFTDVALLVLLSLAGGPKHGYAMIEDIAGFSGTRLEPGTLYGALLRLEGKGWIEPLPADDRRRPYRLTDAGADALGAQLATLRRLVAAGTRRLAPARA
jgi:DNA-binding PadR family transcriptional regulator